MSGNASHITPGKETMIALTTTQQYILDHIRECIEKDGFPPTRAEIAEFLGVRSNNSVVAHLDALARKGVIELTPRTSRGIRLVQQDEGANIIRLPLIGHVAAGTPILAQQNIETFYAADRSRFRTVPDFWLKVRGSSMRNIGILDGDLLAIKKTNVANDGQIIVARIDDEVTVKRFKRMGSNVELIPENPDYEPIIVNEKISDFAIEGLAVGLIRRY